MMDHSIVSLLVFFSFKCVWSHSHIHCHYTDSCSNEILSWNNSNDEYVGIHCHAEGTCFNSTIRSDIGIWTPYCDAAAACIDLKQDSNIIVDGFSCAGYYGCYNAIEIDSNYIWCYGSKSCLGNNEIITKYIECFGFASCINTNIVDASTIYGSGMLSLYNTNITTYDYDDKNNITLLTINMDGFLAGYNTNIICSGDDMCILNCNSKYSCINTNFECIDNANCTINGYYNYSTYNESMIDIFMSLFLNDFEIVNEYKIEDNFIDYYSHLCAKNNCTDKYDCKNKEMTFMSDDMNITSLEQKICVTGYFASTPATFIETDLDIVVDGGYSVRSYEYEARNFYCRGNGACKGNLTSTNGEGSVYCEGYQSCYESTTSYDKYNKWTDIANVYCLGKQSCKINNLYLSNDMNIYGFGSYSLSGSEINTKGDDSIETILKIYLSGYQSGDSMIVNCNGMDHCAIYCMDHDLSCLNDISFEYNCNEDAFCETLTYGQSLSQRPSYNSTEATDEDDGATKQWGINLVMRAVSLSLVLFIYIL